MPVPLPLFARRLPLPLRRHLVVAAAMSWEALLDAHARNGTDILALLSGRMDADELIRRYIGELDVSPAMSAPVRNRILAAAGATGSFDAGELHVVDGPGDARSVWLRLRPDQLVRDVRRRNREKLEVEHLLRLAFARAEEEVIRVHIENAAGFAELLESHMPLHRSVEEYTRYLDLKGGRAQAIYQRTMARFAFERLPRRVPRQLEPPSRSTG